MAIERLTRVKIGLVPEDLSFGIHDDAVRAGVDASHHAAARRGTERADGIGAVEAHAFRGETFVDGPLVFVFAFAIVPVEGLMIGDDEDDIGF